MPNYFDHVDDITQNAGKELLRLSTLYEFPGFVKAASIDMNLKVPPGTPVTCCADPVNQKLWCHTKAATWLSHLFYQVKRAEYHPKHRTKIEERLEKYAAFFGIKQDCDRIKTAYAKQHQTEEDNLPDSAYAYVWTGENGSKERRLPMRSAVEVKAAADYLQQYHDRFSFPVRNHVATRVLTKAASFGASLQNKEYLERQAGRGVCDPKEVCAAIEKRALAIPEDAGVTIDSDGKRTEGLRTVFRKMAESIKALPHLALQPATLLKLAGTLDALDRQLGLTASYGKSLEPPENVLFRVTFDKVATELSAHVATSTGKVYERAAFRKLAKADVRDLLGEEFADRVTTPLGEIDTEKMADEIATLPRPDAALLDGLLSEKSILPVLHKEAAARVGLTPEAMEAIAATYGR